MSIYPCRQDLRPVDHETDPWIAPTQMIAHVAVAWTSGSGPAYHNGLDWHFYVACGPGKPEEIITQLRDTQIQADANFKANIRAISFESEGDGDTPWDEWQVEAIVWLFQKAHDIDKVPLVICPAWDEPGCGYHRLFNEWNKPYHSCPGDKKVAQFRDVIMPRLQQPTPTPIPTPPVMEDDNMGLILHRDEGFYHLIDGRLIVIKTEKFFWELAGEGVKAIELDATQMEHYVTAFGQPV